ncbi:MAG: NfeD family protein [Sphingomonas sp.]
MGGHDGLWWLAAALVLGIAELITPGLFLVFFAIAAAATGVAVFALSDLPLVAQLGSFAVWSAVTVLIGKRWYRQYPVASDDALLNDRAARLVGEIVTVDEAIVHGHGRVRVGDGVWPAHGPETAANTRMRVAAVSDGIVIVEPIELPAP